MVVGSIFSATGGPCVVGVVHSPGSLTAALSLMASAPAAPPGVIELRVDAFAARPGALDALLAAAPRPFLLTVRDPAESGGGAVMDPSLADPRRRAELLARFMPAAALVDVGLRYLADPAFVDVLRGAGNVPPLVASFHDFTGTPPAAELRARAERARAAGAAIFKVAARVTTPADVAQLLLLLDDPPLPVAAMGMGGPLARAARLVLAAAGSVLNYGSLGEDAGGIAAPGQWPVARMAGWLTEIGARRAGSWEGADG